MLILKYTKLFFIPWLVIVSLGISCSEDVNDVQPDQPLLASFNIPIFNAFDNTDSVVFEYNENRIIDEISIYTASQFLREEFHLDRKVFLKRNVFGNITSMEEQIIIDNERTNESTTTFEYDNGLIVKSESNNGVINYGYNAQGLLTTINNTEIDYDVNGNVLRFSNNSGIPDSEYDNEMNPFLNIPIPKVILLQISGGYFNRRPNYRSSVLSNNNLLFEDNCNAYRSDGLPRNICINNHNYILDYSYTDE